MLGLYDPRELMFGARTGGIGTFRSPPFVLLLSTDSQLRLSFSLKVSHHASVEHPTTQPLTLTRIAKSASCLLAHF